MQNLATRLLERNYLAMVLIVPLWFSTITISVFEADKATLLLALSASSIGLFFFSTVPIGNKRTFIFERLGKSTCLVIFIVLHLAAQVIAGLFSVDQNVSFFGTEQRPLGLLLTIACVLLIPILTVVLQAPSALQKLIIFLIVGSVPVAFYALLQRLGWSNISWGGDVVERASSTLGNPVSLGAYMGLMVPITAGVIAYLIVVLKHTSKARFPLKIIIAVLLLILGLQLAALILSDSRGPQLALLLCSAMVLVLIVLRRASMQRLIVLSLACILLTLSCVAMVWQPAKRIVVESSSLDTPSMVSERQSAKARILIWNGLGQALFFESKSMSIKEAPHFNFRPIFGHGQLTMRLLFGPYHNPALAYVEQGDSVPDDAHNIVFNTVFASGLFGLLTLLGLLLISWSINLRMLFPSVSQHVSKTLLKGCLLSGICMLFVVYAIGIQALAFAGLAVGVGIVMALLLSILMLKKMELKLLDVEPAPVRLKEGILHTVLLACSLMFWLEQQFGVATLVSHFFFYVCLGTTVACFVQKDTAVLPIESLKPFDSSWFEVLSSSLNSAVFLVLLILLCSFTAHQILYVGTTVTSTSHTLSIGLFTVLLLVIVQFSIRNHIFITGSSATSWIPLPAVLLLILIVLLEHLSAVIFPFSLLSQHSALEQLKMINTLKVNAVYGVNYLILSSILFSLWRSEYLRAPRLFFLFIVSAGLGLMVTHLVSSPLAASAANKQAMEFESRQFWHQCIERLHVSLNIDSQRQIALTNLSRCALGASTQVAADPGARSQTTDNIHDFRSLNVDDFLAIPSSQISLIDEHSLRSLALSALKLARNITPLEADHWLNLGRTQTYLSSILIKQGLARDELTMQALRSYQQASTLRPNNIRILSEIGLLFDSLGQHRQAIEANERVLQLIPNSLGAIKNLAVLSIKVRDYGQSRHYLDLGFKHAKRLSLNQELAALKKIELALNSLKQ